jgi:hypothetical protein
MRFSPDTTRGQNMVPANHNVRALTALPSTASIKAIDGHRSFIFLDRSLGRRKQCLRLSHSPTVLRGGRNR